MNILLYGSVLALIWTESQAEEGRNDNGSVGKGAWRLQSVALRDPGTSLQ